MDGQDLLFAIAICGTGAGILWAFLVVQNMGPLEAVERLGLRLASWARAQKTARQLYRATYAAYRKSAAVADEAIQQQEG